MALRAEDARALLNAELNWKRAKMALEAAESQRTKVRDRCRPRLEVGAQTVGGVKITITPTTTGQSFSLKGYLERHKLTKTMEPFVGEGREYDRWTVKAATP
jgi:hypothetical protein